MVYDAGQDSEANQAHIEATPLHFIGSLPPSDFPDLLAVSARRYRPVDARPLPGADRVRHHGASPWAPPGA